MRFAALWLAGALVTLAAGNDAPGGAPVPKHVMKPAAPAKLTPEMLQGTWKYAWASSLDGTIEFNAKDGTYLAQHAPGASTIYSGTFSVGDDSIVLTEWGCDVNTGRHWGPAAYLLKFDDVKGPTLAGKTSGSFAPGAQAPEVTMPLKLSK